MGVLVGHVAVVENSFNYRNAEMFLNESDTLQLILLCEKQQINK